MAEIDSGTFGVRNGRPVITASATAPIDFALQIFRYLGLYSPEVMAAWYGLFKTGKPEYFAAFMQAPKA